MSEHTALSVGTDDRLDLAALAEACEAMGLYASATSRGFLLCVPGKRKRCRWRGTTQEHGWLLVILRDVVRGVLAGSYCAPTLIDPDADHDCPLCVTPRDAEMRFPQGVPMFIYGRTETECWARALVALHRAGLLPSAPQNDREPDGHDHEEADEQGANELPVAGSHGGQDTGGGG